MTPKRAGVLGSRRIYDQAFARLLLRSGFDDVDLAELGDPTDPEPTDPLDTVFVLAAGEAVAGALEQAASRWPGAAVVLVADGAVPTHPTVWSRLEACRQLTGLAPTPARPTAAVQHLTPREQEVLQLLSEGLGTSDIASRLEISPHTARTHVQNVLGRLGVASRAEAVALALRRPERRPAAPAAAGPSRPEGTRTAAVIGIDPLDAAALGAALEDLGMVVVACGVDPTDAAAGALARHADVLFVDVGLDGGGAATAVATVKSERAATHALAVYDDLSDGALRDLVECGVDGFVRVQDPLDSIPDMLERVAAGDAAIPPSMLGPLLRSLINRHREEDEAIERYTGLSDKERQVLALLSKGQDHQGIADALVVSRHTARTHIQNVLRKLGVHSRLEAMAFADRYDLLTRFPPTGGAT